MDEMTLIKRNNFFPLQEITDTGDPLNDNIIPPVSMQPQERYVSASEAVKAYHFRKERIDQINEELTAQKVSSFSQDVSAGLHRTAESFRNFVPEIENLTVRLFDGHKFPDATENEALTIANASTYALMARKQALQQVEQREGTADSITANLTSGASQVVALGLAGLATGGYGIGVIAGAQEAGDISQDWAEDYITKKGSLEGYNAQKDSVYALAHGAVAGFIEQGLGVERLFSPVVSAKLGKRAIAHAIKGAAGEGAEEYAQEWSRYVFSNVTGHENRSFVDFQKDAATNAVYGAVLGGTFGGLMYHVNRKRIVNNLANDGFTMEEASKIADEVIETGKSAIINELEVRNQLQAAYGENYDNLVTKIESVLNFVGWQEKFPDKDIHKYADTVADDIGLQAIKKANQLHLPISEVLDLGEIQVKDNVIFLEVKNLNDPKIISDMIKDKKAQIKELRGQLAIDNKANITSLKNQIYVLETRLKSLGFNEQLSKERSARQRAGIDQNVIANTAPEILGDIQGIRQANVNEDFVYVGTSRVPVEYVVKPLSEVQSSHVRGEVNPNYSLKELQNRARGTVTDEAILQNRAANLKPEELITSPNSQYGAPIVNEKGEVIAGNGRLETLRKAYDMGNAQGYIDALNKLGYATEGIEKPVLVRQTTDILTPKQQIAIAEASNVSETSAFDHARLAKNDSKALEKGASDALSFADSLPVAERQRYIKQDGTYDLLALQRRFDDAFMAWVLGDDKTFEAVLLNNKLSQKVVSGITSRGAAIIDFANRNPSSGIKEDLRRALIKSANMRSKADFVDTIQQIDIEEGTTFASDSLLYGMTFSNNSSQLGTFLESYIAKQDGYNNSLQDSFLADQMPKMSKDDLVAQTIRESTLTDGKWDKDGATSDPDLRALFLNQIPVEFEGEGTTRPTQLFQLGERKGRGYVGYSMSVNMAEAQANNELTASKAAKALGVSTDAIREVLTPSAWHHASLYYNKVDVYDINPYLALKKGLDLTEQGYSDSEIADIRDNLEKMKKMPKPNQNVEQFIGNASWVEWTGTRAHPKSVEHKETGIKIEKKGSFYTFYLKDGTTVKKKIGSNGTSVISEEELLATKTFDELQKSRIEQMKDIAQQYKPQFEQYVKDNHLDKPTAETFEKFRWDINQAQDNIYVYGQKPYSADKTKGLRKIHTDSLDSGDDGLIIKSGVLQEWNGEKWVDVQEVSNLKQGKEKPLQTAGDIALTENEQYRQLREDYYSGAPERQEVNRILYQTGKLSKDHKQKQLDIILRENPMEDDYHVGIRKVEDIKTFEETLDDEESFVWGDYTREDAKADAERGLVTVYSSYPIKDGVFVSTSYIQANEYAGRSEKVYKKTVSTDKIAWINGDEGQFADVTPEAPYDPGDTFFYQNANGFFDTELKAIVIGSSFNFGTLPHEIAHFFLDKDFAIWKSGKAPEEFMQDFDQLAEILGITHDQLQLTRDQQEQFASMTEGYIFNKAAFPDNAAPVLQAYWDWVPAQYNSLLDIGYKDSKGKIYNPIFDKKSKEYFDNMYSALAGLGKSPMVDLFTNPENDKDKKLKTFSELAKDRQAAFDAEASEKLKDALPNQPEEVIQASIEQQNRPDPVIEQAYSEAVEAEEARTPTLKEKFEQFVKIGRGTNTRADMDIKAQEFIAKNRQKAEEIAFGSPIPGGVDIEGLDTGTGYVENTSGVDRAVLIVNLMNGYQSDSPEYAALYHNLALTRSYAGKTPGLTNDISQQFYLRGYAEMTRLMEEKAAVKRYGKGKDSVDLFRRDIDSFIQKNIGEVLKTAPDTAQREAALNNFLNNAKIAFGEEGAQLLQEDLNRARKAKSKEKAFFEDWARREIKKLAKANPSDIDISELMTVSVAAQKASADIDSNDTAKAVAASLSIRKWQDFVKDKGISDSLMQKIIGQWAPRAMLSGVSTHVVNIVSNTVNVETTKLAMRFHYGKSVIPKSVIKAENQRLWAIYEASGINSASSLNVADPALLHGESYTLSTEAGLLQKIDPFRWLGREDFYFRSDVYLDALARIASKNANYDPKKALELFNEYKKMNLAKGDNKNARMEALTVGNIAVFQQNGTLARVVSGIRDYLDLFNLEAFGEKGHRGLGTLIAPFAKTPANIVAMGVDAVISPFKLLAYKTGIKKNWSISDSVAMANFIPTVAIVMLMIAAAGDYEEPYSGGSYDADKPYDSIRIGNVWIGLDSFGAMATPLRFALTLVNNIKKGTPSNKLAGKGLKALAEGLPVLDKGKDWDYLQNDPVKYLSMAGYNQVNKLFPAIARNPLKIAVRASGAKIDTGNNRILRKFARAYGLDGKETSINDYIRLLYNRVRIEE